MNRYLEKIAEDLTERQRAGVNSLISGAGAAAVLNDVPDKLLGYHTVYHGTSSESADKILKEGLSPKHGGTEGGASATHGSARFKEQSQGKVHVTKNPATAEFFSQYSGGDGVFSSVTMSRDGKVLKGRIPHSMFESMEVDKDMGADATKFTAATTKHKIGPEFIQGSDSYRGAKQFIHAKHLNRYYSSTSGLKRGLTGVAQAGLGLGLTAYSALQAKKSLQEPK